MGANFTRIVTNNDTIATRKASRFLTVYADYRERKERCGGVGVGVSEIFIVVYITESRDFLHFKLYH